MNASRPTTPGGADLDALICDYNLVIGEDPSSSQWTGIAELAGWQPHESRAFQQAFWERRAAYDEGAISTVTFWSGLLRSGRTAPAGSTLLTDLTSADIDLWTTTDPAVLGVLSQAHAAGLRLVLLSNAPKPLANVLDDSDWCVTLFTRTVFSARIGVNKPDGRAFEAALEAAGWPQPWKTLFVDDRLENVEAAERLGLQTLHYTGDPAALARRLPRTLAVTRPTVLATNT
ncbi:HAD-IA family hydrolase [Streptomyces sp. NPDC090493]|uniref:HAD-IA family hydrolase n=1 Tax=Streptomyces sp. NPDC090493 TaxID=3365964 RepID=UPI00382F7955